ncbi:MAG: signal peptidase I, partial [Spirochaetaceae bacterium]
MKLDEMRQIAAQKFAVLQDWLLEKTEAMLSARKRRKLVKKEKQKRKNQIIDWVQALLWAACVVLVINQYLVQAYAIPTGSMEDTIIGEDRIFVDKVSYGPELVPGALKFPGFKTPSRGEIVVFVNPEYEKDMDRQVSWLEQLYHRLAYMLTFTMWNLDVKPNGDVAHHFLVKRLVGAPGEQLRMRGGRVQIRPEHETAWVAEDSIRKQRIG